MPPVALLLDVLLYVVAPAALAAASVFALVVHLSSRRSLVVAGGALAFLAGLTAANYFRDVFPLLPEQAAWHWLPWAALAAGGVEAVVRIGKTPALVAGAVRLAAATVFAWLLVGAAPWWAWVALALALVAEWWVLNQLAEHEPGGLFLLGLAFVLLAASLVLIHAGSGRLSDAATIAAAALAGIFGVAWWKGADSAGAAASVSVLLPGLLWTGHNETYSEVPTTSFLLAALAPLAPALALVPPVGRLPGSARRLVTLVLFILPALAAVVLAMRAETLVFE